MPGKQGNLRLSPVRAGLAPGAKYIFLVPTGFAIRTLPRSATVSDSRVVPDSAASDNAVDSAVRTRRRWPKGWILVFVLGAAIVFWSPLCSIVKVQFGLPPGTTNVWQYRQVRALHDSTLVGHFPSGIPSDAIDPRLYYTPRFLQGGSEFQVSYRLPPPRIQDILADARARAKAAYGGPGSGMDYVSQSGGYPVPLNQLGGSDGLTFSSAYLIFVFAAEPYFPNDWNHGYSCGLCVNESDSVVVYWAEGW